MGKVIPKKVCIGQDAVVFVTPERLGILHKIAAFCALRASGTVGLIKAKTGAIGVQVSLLRSEMIQVAVFLGHGCTLLS